MNVRRSTINLRTTPPLSSRKRSGLSRNSTRYVLRRNPTREVLSFCRRVTTTKCSCSRPTVSSHSSLNRPPLTSSTHSLALSLNISQEQSGSKPASRASSSADVLGL
eukprot:scaffold59537_cov50-Phaeocystis_antarctica.AAC.1